MGTSVNYQLNDHGFASVWADEDALEQSIIVMIHKANKRHQGLNAALGAGSFDKRLGMAMEPPVSSGLIALQLHETLSSFHVSCRLGHTTYGQQCQVPVSNISVQYQAIIFWYSLPWCLIRIGHIAKIYSPSQLSQSCCCASYFCWN